MLIIPVGTDAPIYHWPVATVGLIVLNIACFIFVPPGRSDDDVDENGEAITAPATPYERYALALGDGLHPTQWVTHNFLHIGIGHLVGNMIFLWAFGVVVEGKLGPFRYLLVYLLIGTLHGALTQTLFLRSEFPFLAVGASAIIFGLLAICMVWAPHNEVNCTWIMFIGFRVFVKNFDLRYTWVAALYLGEQVLGLALGGLTGRAVVSEMGHLSGAFWGLAVGLAMLKLGWVDCEGWDIFSLMKKRRELAKNWKRRGEQLDRRKKADRAVHRRVAAAEADDPDERASSALKKVRKLIDMGDHASAISEYDRSARVFPDWPGPAELLALIKAMHAAKAEADSLPLMRDYCRKYPASSDKMRLKMAQVLIRDREKPTAALRILSEIPAGSLTGNSEAARIHLTRQAERMVEDGVLELEGED